MTPARVTHVVYATEPLVMGPILRVNWKLPDMTDVVVDGVIVTQAGSASPYFTSADVASVPLDVIGASHINVPEYDPVL